VIRPSDTIVHTSDAGMFTSLPRARPTQVYVLTYKDGSTRVVRGAPTAADRYGSRTCHLVETALRSAHGQFTVPASGDGFEFRAEVDVTWQVTDPELVVRRGVDHGADVVLGHVGDLVWTVGRQYAPTDAHLAEMGIRQAITRGDRPMLGLSIRGANVRVRADGRVAQAAIDRATQRHAIGQQQERVEHLRSLLKAGNDWLLVHLAEKPEDTSKVLELILTAQDRSDQMDLALFDRLVEHKLIMPEELDELKARRFGSGRQTLFGTGPALSNDPAPPALDVRSRPGAPGADPDHPVKDPDPASSPPQSRPAADGNGGDLVRRGRDDAGGVRRWKAVNRLGDDA